jgi:hypothetical protein
MEGWRSSPSVLSDLVTVGVGSVGVFFPPLSGAGLFQLVQACVGGGGDVCGGVDTHSFIQLGHGWGGTGVAKT